MTATCHWSEWSPRFYGALLFLQIYTKFIDLFCGTGGLLIKIKFKIKMSFGTDEDGCLVIVVLLLLGSGLLYLGIYLIEMRGDNATRFLGGFACVVLGIICLVAMVRYFFDI